MRESCCWNRKYMKPHVLCECGAKWEDHGTKHPHITTSCTGYKVKMQPVVNIVSCADCTRMFWDMQAFKSHIRRIDCSAEKKRRLSRKNYDKKTREEVLSMSPPVYIRPSESEKREEKRSTFKKREINLNVEVIAIYPEEDSGGYAIIQWTTGDWGIDASGEKDLQGPEGERNGVQETTRVELRQAMQGNSCTILGREPKMSGE